METLHYESPDMLCVYDFEKFALKHLPKIARDFYSCGANHEKTLRENQEAFNRYKLRPRILKDVSKRICYTSVLGRRISFPVGISPTAMQKMAHPDGEIATARAASLSGTVMILSTVSTSSIEEVAQNNPSGLHWFQLYMNTDREITRQLVQRAEKSGYLAIVLTVDLPVLGLRFPNIRNKFSTPSHLRLANYSEDDPCSNYAPEHIYNESLTWNDVHWLQTITALPIVIKGILTAEDAVLALQHGASAIMVSNHGARQLDGVSATIDVLPEIVQAVNGKCEIYMDGGVRNGTDILKALALGAKAVFVGRPILWGLAHSGEFGVRKVLDILRNELDVAMALSGCATLDDIQPSLVIKEAYYSRL